MISLGTDYTDFTDLLDFFYFCEICVIRVICVICEIRVIRVSVYPCLKKIHTICFLVYISPLLLCHK